MKFILIVVILLTTIYTQNSNSGTFDKKDQAFQASNESQQQGLDLTEVSAKQTSQNSNSGSQQLSNKQNVSQQEQKEQTKMQQKQSQQQSTIQSDIQTELKNDQEKQPSQSQPQSNDQKNDIKEYTTATQSDINDVENSILENPYFLQGEISWYSTIPDVDNYDMVSDILSIRQSTNYDPTIYPQQRYPEDPKPEEPQPTPQEKEQNKPEQKNNEQQKQPEDETQQEQKQPEQKTPEEKQPEKQEQKGQKDEQEVQHRPHEQQFSNQDIVLWISVFLVLFGSLVLSLLIVRRRIYKCCLWMKRTKEEEQGKHIPQSEVFSDVIEMV